ncbi:MAG: hypothetical protein LT070_08830 [Solirubrobacteraceae bacterium]|nr:hypothetical protein [Solirubrobacteraceae bacterium]
MTRHVIALTALALLAPAASAQAGPPGSWTKVTGIGQPDLNISEVGLARTGDGVLHVLWTRRAGLGGDVLHSRVAADAKSVGGPVTVFHYPGGVNESALLLRGPGGGLRAFFSGLSAGSALDEGLATATWAGGGWAVQPTLASNSTPAGLSNVYVAAGIGGALRTDGTPIAAWGDSAPGASGYHVGLSPAAPDAPFTSGCCAYDPSVGVDAASGQAVIAWKFIESASGTAVRSLVPAGGRVSPPGGAAADTGTRTAITGRLGGMPGIYLAYQRGDNQFLSRPALWRVGADKPLLLSSSRGARSIGIAPAPGGRLWVFWHRDGSVVARRSNAAATRFGATRTIKPPKGTDTIHRVAGEGSAGPLDVLALIERSGSDLGHWQQRVLPGLTLAAKAKSGHKVLLTVTDAGDAVPGAKVSIAGKSGKTGAKGTLTLKLKQAGSFTAKAGKTGYAGAKAKVKVK